MASTASLQPQQSHQPPPPASMSPDTPPPQTKSSLSSPQNISTDHDSEQTDQYSNSVSLQQRMDQFLSMTTAAAAAAAAANNRMSSSTKRGNHHNNNPSEQGIGESYQYQDASATSGSNSADEDDGESHQDAESEISGGAEGGNGKRGRGHFNGYSSSKKRRKQSKPIRLSAGDAQSLPQKDLPEEDRSPSEARRYSEEEELEEGERVPRGHRDDEEEYEEGARADGPLNLSATSSKDPDLVDGEEEGEVVRNGTNRTGGLQPSLRVLGAELMQSNGPESLTGLKIPPGLSAQQASSIPSSLYQGMLQFGLPPFPFPFPLTSQAGGQPGTPSSLSGKMPPTSIPMSSSSSSGPPLSAGGRVQIFNPEAYCELCNKEFCNKYFLKTHKANKHGIYSESGGGNGAGGAGAPGSSSPGGGPNLQNSSSPGPVRGGPDGNTAGPPTPNSQPGGERGSPFSGAFIAANMGSLRPPFLPLSPGASPSPTSTGNLPNSSNGGVNPSSIGKEFASKDHGTLKRDAPSRGSEAGDREQASSPISSSASLTPRSSMPHGVIPGLPPSSQPNAAAAAAAAAMMFSPGGTPIGGIPDFRQSSEDRERLMGRQYFDKEIGELQRSIERGSPRASLSQLTSGAFNPLLFGGIPSMDSLKKQEEGIRRDMGGRPSMSSESGSMPNIPNLTSPSGRSGHEPKGPFTPEKLRQMGVINADAFCEICCKEFCNKYFLRVHKLKKHGICSPDLPPEKVQKILNQMAKEAGKTGNPPPPIVRPPMLGGPMGLNPADKFDSLPHMGSGHPPMPTLRPPTGLINAHLPPLEPLPLGLRDALPNLPPPPQLVLEAGREKERQRLISNEKDREREDSSIDAEPAEVRARERSQNSLHRSHGLEEGEREIIRINDDSGAEEEEDDGKISDTQKRTNDDRMDKEGKDNPANGGEDLQRLQSMIMELNSSKSKAAQAAAQFVAGDMGEITSTICRVCNKDMENKYFLRAHMMNEHGVLHMEDTNHISNIARSEAENIRREQTALEEDQMTNGLEHDFAAKFLQQMQKGVGGLPNPLGGPIGEEHSFLERVKAELAAASGMKAPSFDNKMLNESPGGDKDPNRKPASLSRSYCEICKKELCNKYFMKTHMLKMHGINIESIPGPIGAVSQANSTSMGGLSGGVSCHICKKELCSKYFLKVHMQNSHGIITGIDGVMDMGPGGLPPFPPGMVEGSGAVSNLFKGLFPMGGPPPELLSLPSGDQEKDRYFSRLLGEQSEISRERLKDLEKLGRRNSENPERHTKHSCSLCGDTFPEIVALQVHIIKNHGAFPPEGSGSFEGIQRPKRPQSDDQQLRKTPSSNNRSSHNDLNEAKDAISITADGVGDTTSSSGNEEGLVATRHRSEGEGIEEDGEENNQRDERSSTTSNTPQKNSTSSNGANGPHHLTKNSSMPQLPSGFLDKQAFPHIEMLQRHMLSQQFPGLLNPALLSAAGFPGFGANSSSENGVPTSNGANSNIQQFSGLQQLLVGGKNISSSRDHNDTSIKITEDEDEDHEEGEVVKIRKTLNPNASRKRPSNDHPLGPEKLKKSPEGYRKIKAKRFKCSKCNQKFRRRDICLRHIHQNHSASLSGVPRRQLRFFSPNSPKKSMYSANKVNTKARSHYVRQLMDLLKVPTSRGTPHKAKSDGEGDSSPEKVQHIMQAFLLKAPTTPTNTELSTDETAAHSIDDNGNNFVPSIVYLPVARRVSEPMTVAFDLTPA